jgi:hypothetical protein
MTSIMPPPRYDENQRQIFDRIAGTVATAEKAIDGRRSRDYHQVGAGVLAKLKFSIEAGRDMYIANEKTWEASSTRHPVHIMRQPPPGGPEIAIWPGPIFVPESEYSKRLGDDMEAGAQSADAAFQRLLDALEKALEPAQNGKVYLWNGELRALEKAIGAYEALLSTYENDKAQFVDHRAVDNRNTPVPPMPPIVPLDG